MSITGDLTRYQNMRGHFADLRVGGVPINGGNPGHQTYFVDSGHSAASATNTGLTADEPVSSLATLLDGDNGVTLAAGDVVFVMPDHAETITGAGGLAFATAGISVVGLGIGNQRPRFLMDGGTSVTATITAADVYIENMVFAAGHADIVTCFDITAVHATLVECEFVDNTTDENFLTEIKATSTTDNNADGLTVIGCRALTPDAAGLEFIEINADVDELIVKDNVVVKDAATAAKLIAVATGKDLRECVVADNTLTLGTTSGDLVIDNDTSVNTGVVYGNVVGHHIPDTAATVLVDCDGVREWGNRGIKADSDNYAYENPVLGRHVRKTADISAAPDAMFDISGKCMITLLVGEVTSVLATSSSMSINTSTTDIVLAASTTITSDALGTLYVVCGDIGLGFNAGATPNVDACVLDVGTVAPIIINDDQIEQNVNSGGTGLVQWDLWYVPLEPGAYVVAAA